MPAGEHQPRTWLGPLRGVMKRPAGSTTNPATTQEPVTALAARNSGDAWTTLQPSQAIGAHGGLTSHASWGAASHGPRGTSTGGGATSSNGGVMRLAVGATGSITVTPSHAATVVALTAADGTGNNSAASTPLRLLPTTGPPTPTTDAGPATPVLLPAAGPGSTGPLPLPPLPAPLNASGTRLMQTTHNEWAASSGPTSPGRTTQPPESVAATPTAISPRERINPFSSVIQPGAPGAIRVGVGRASGSPTRAAGNSIPHVSAAC